MGTYSVLLNLQNNLFMWILLSTTTIAFLLWKNNNINYSSNFYMIRWYSKKINYIWNKLLIFELWTFRNVLISYVDGRCIKRGLMGLNAKRILSVKKTTNMIVNWDKVLVMILKQWRTVSKKIQPRIKSALESEKSFLKYTFFKVIRYLLPNCWSQVFNKSVEL